MTNWTWLDAQSNFGKTEKRNGRGLDPTTVTDHQPLSKKGDGYRRV